MFRYQYHFDKMMSLAVKDPQGFVRSHHRGVTRALGRPRVKGEFDARVGAGELQVDDIVLLTGLSEGRLPVGMSDEDKAKWHARIQRILPVLKVIAQFVPPPYNLAIIALIVILTIIDQNRLTPAQLGWVLSLPENLSGELPPAFKEQDPMFQFWQTAIPFMIDAFVAVFGEGSRKWFEQIFGKSSFKEMTEPIINVSAAPDEIKDVVRNLLASLVEKALAGKPLMLRIALAVVKNLPDAFMDKLWDSVFKAQISAGLLKASVNLPRNVMASTPAYSEGDVLAAKAEVGLS